MFKLPKVAESLWFFMYYCITFSAESYLLMTADWTTSLKNYWNEEWIAPPIKEYDHPLFFISIDLT